MFQDGLETTDQKIMYLKKMRQVIAHEIACEKATLDLDCRSLPNRSPLGFSMVFHIFFYALGPRVFQSY